MANALSRQDELLDNAQSQLEAGEQIQHSVLVRQGLIRQQNHALIATDRNLYAFRLSWPGFSKIAEQLGKWPLADVSVEAGLRSVKVRSASSGEETSWKRLKFRDPSDLADYVNGQLPAAGPDAGAGRPPAST